MACGNPCSMCEAVPEMTEICMMCEFSKNIEYSCRNPSCSESCRNVPCSLVSMVKEGAQDFLEGLYNITRNRGMKTTNSTLTMVPKLADYFIDWPRPAAAPGLELVFVLFCFVLLRPVRSMIENRNASSLTSPHIYTHAYT